MPSHRKRLHFADFHVRHCVQYSLRIAVPQLCMIVSLRPVERDHSDRCLRKLMSKNPKNKTSCRIDITILCVVYLTPMTTQSRTTTPVQTTTSQHSLGLRCCVTLGRLSPKLCGLLNEPSRSSRQTVVASDTNGMGIISHQHDRGRPPSVTLHRGKSSEKGRGLGGRGSDCAHMSSAGSGLNAGRPSVRR